MAPKKQKQKQPVKRATKLAKVAAAVGFSADALEAAARFAPSFRQSGSWPAAAQLACKTLHTLSAHPTCALVILWPLHEAFAGRGPHTRRTAGERLSTRLFAGGAMTPLLALCHAQATDHDRAIADACLARTRAAPAHKLAQALRLAHVPDEASSVLPHVKAEQMCALSPLLFAQLLCALVLDDPAGAWAACASASPPLTDELVRVLRVTVGSALPVADRNPEALALAADVITAVRGLVRSGPPAVAQALVAADVLAALVPLAVHDLPPALLPDLVAFGKAVAEHCSDPNDTLQVAPRAAAKAFGDLKAESASAAAPSAVRGAMARDAMGVVLEVLSVSSPAAAEALQPQLRVALPVLLALVVQPLACEQPVASAPQTRAIGLLAQCYTDSAVVALDAWPGTALADALLTAMQALLKEPDTTPPPSLPPDTLLPTEQTFEALLMVWSAVIRAPDALDALEVDIEEAEAEALLAASPAVSHALRGGLLKRVVQYLRRPNTYPVLLRAPFSEALGVLNEVTRWPPRVWLEEYHAAQCYGADGVPTAPLWPLLLRVVSDEAGAVAPTATRLVALEVVERLIEALAPRECHERVFVPYGSTLLRALIACMRPTTPPASSAQLPGSTAAEPLAPVREGATNIRTDTKLSADESDRQFSALLALDALLAHGEALGMEGGALVPARGVGHPNRYALAVEECAPDALSVIESLQLSDDPRVYWSASQLLCHYFDTDPRDVQFVEIAPAPLPPVARSG